MNSHRRRRNISPSSDESTQPLTHLVSLLVHWVLQLCGGEQRPQVVRQNGLLADAAQREVLQKPDVDQDAEITAFSLKKHLWADTKWCNIYKNTVVLLLLLV